MPQEQTSDRSFVEFLDDYYVECEEHLAVSRRSLLALEIFVGQSQVDRHVLDELFRSFHSLKGLSAMVGVREAEQLAHQMESFLSALRKGELRLTADGFDALIDGVKALEQVIEARRAGASLPDVGALLVRLGAFLPSEERPRGPIAEAENSWGLSAEKSALLSAALQTGARVWHFTFTPSPELAQRDVNVNTVRRRLQEAGDLIHATPNVMAQGQISFSFLVASRAEESTFAPWREDGLTCTLYEAPDSRVSEALEQGTNGSVGASRATPLTPSNIVRVDLGRLDDLMRLVGELVISRARLDENVKRLGTTLRSTEWRALHETNLAFDRQLRDLREGVMRVRLVPVREVFARMQFVVRDLVRENGKKVTLELSGQETEIDKLVVERMMDPLLHLVRNSVSHGLESPEERTSQGKPSEGKLYLRASTTGETVVIEVEDDGRGLDVQAIMARAKAARIFPEDATLDTITLLDIICAPGFSTRAEADRESGRGVGMAVVRSVVEELGGSLVLDTRAGQGTKFTIQLPLTLAIADALIVTVGGQTFAMPQVSVREVVHVLPGSVTALENNEIIPYRAGVLPLLRLADFLAIADAQASEGVSPQASSDRPFFALVISSGLSAVGVTVDRVLGLREIVVRPLTDAVIRVPGVSGATELGDGRAVLILDAVALARAARQKVRNSRARPASKSTRSEENHNHA